MFYLLCNRYQAESLDRTGFHSTIQSSDAIAQTEKTSQREWKWRRSASPIDTYTHTEREREKERKRKVRKREIEIDR